jgi:hypothetical protein
MQCEHRVEFLNEVNARLQKVKVRLIQYLKFFSLLQNVQTTAGDRSPLFCVTNTYVIAILNLSDKKLISW